MLLGLATILAGASLRWAATDGLVAAGVALLVASHVLAPDGAGSWSSIAHAARLYLAFACLVASARRLASLPMRLAWTSVMVGVVLTLHGAVQVAWLHPGLAEGATASQLAQLADGRANSVFVLPAHLGAFLALSTTSALALAWTLRRSPVRWLALGCAAVSTVGMVLAGSFGGLLTHGVALGSFAFLVLPARLRRPFLIGLAALAVAVALLSALRRSDELTREGPLSARAENWATALVLIRESPVIGHGGGGFAREQSRARSARSNQAARAHQGLLEPAVEHGLPALVLVLAWLGRLAGAVARSTRTERLEPLQAGLVGATIGLVAFALVDFSWSDPGWSAPACMVAGVAWAALRPDASRVSRLRVEGLLPAALIAVVVSDSFVSGRVQGALERARLEMEDGEVLEARSLALAATRWDGGRADAWATSAMIELESVRPGLSDAERRRRLAVAVELAERGVRASPRDAAAHAVLARCLVANGRRVEALASAARAAQLAPTITENVELRDRIAEALSEEP